ncbi:ABC transporter ATP-binding protein [Hwanghaeella sp.]|uniref:ABC transporter ATP-binding protein n=1 Tax=Hwanghaeella sp. TaxID=2605943 RepID=UPI003CCBC91E
MNPTLNVSDTNRAGADASAGTEEVMAAVGIDAIQKSFGSVDVLKSVDLAIEDGEFMTLVGPSGCGKSTLLRIIAGLESQDSGSVRIGERTVDGLRPSDRDLAMVFQSYALYPHLTVAQNIAVPLRMRNLTSAERLPFAGRLSAKTADKNVDIQRQVRRVAEQLDIAHLLDRKPKQLSGGQRQRVAVGRAMVRNPNVFLMDEPLSNLDAKLRVHMRTEIADLHRSLGTTFIYVTHDQAEAMTMSSRIAVMMEGDLIQVAPPETVYDDPADIRVAEFIGSPKINILTGLVTDRGDVGSNGVAIDVLPESAPGTAVKLGIRPEKIDLAAIAPGRLTAEIRHLENLGPDMLVHLRARGEKDALVARCPADRARGMRIGEQVGLTFSPGDVLVFDANTGRRVSAQYPEPVQEKRHA